MTSRRPVSPSPEPLEAFAARFDDFLGRRSQRESFRRYLEGLLLSQERNKTLTALANAEPILGAHNPSVQTLQWFLSESSWKAAEINARRKELLFAGPITTPHAQGVLVIDETGDRKDGSKTAHVGRQYLGSLGKVDNGVVSVSSLFADGQIYYPLEVEPYTPASWFAKGKNDPKFRTKPQIALELVQREVAAGTPFRAVVADCVYGENDLFCSGLQRTGSGQRLGRQVGSGPIGFVLALRRSHSWWHIAEDVGSLLEAAQIASGTFADADHPGEWEKVVRSFTDGHEEVWWALEVRVKPYGPERLIRAVVATTDPVHLPEASTWFLRTNLPAPGSERAKTSSPSLAPADLAEVVRLYGLRNWVEQSYKQVKQSLGWAQYQVRSDTAIRRHWALVWCAFSFVWWNHQSYPNPAPAADSAPADSAPADSVRERGENGGNQSKHRFGRDRERVCLSTPLSSMLAGKASVGARLAGAVDLVTAHLACLERSASPAGDTPVVGPPAARQRNTNL